MEKKKISNKKKIIILASIFLIVFGLISIIIGIPKKWEDVKSWLKDSNNVKIINNGYFENTVLNYLDKNDGDLEKFKELTMSDFMDNGRLKVSSSDMWNYEKYVDKVKGKGAVFCVDPDSADYAEFETDTLTEIYNKKKSGLGSNLESTSQWVEAVIDLEYNPNGDDYIWINGTKYKLTGYTYEVNGHNGTNLLPYLMGYIQRERKEYINGSFSGNNARND